MSRPKIGSGSYNRAVFLKDRALSIVQERGSIKQTNVGRVRMYKARELIILFSDPTTFAEISIDIKTLTPRQQGRSCCIPKAWNHVAISTFGHLAPEEAPGSAERGLERGNGARSRDLQTW